MWNSQSNEKQSGGSVGGYTGPGVETLIKASWHLKSSVIRQSIWVKRAPFCLSHFRPTPERGTTQVNKAAGKSRHLFSRCGTKHESVAAARQRDRVSLEEPVSALHVLFARVSSVRARLAHPSQSPEPWPSTWLELQSRSHRPCRKGEVGASTTGCLMRRLRRASCDVMKYFLMPACPKPRLVPGATEMAVPPFKGSWSSCKDGTSKYDYDSV